MSSAVPQADQPVQNALTRTCTWCVPHAHPALAGHFPGRPILPGVSVLQRGLDLWVDAREQSRWTFKVRSAKFLQICEPGDELEFCLSVTSGSAASVFEADQVTLTVMHGPVRVLQADLLREAARVPA